MTIKFRPLHDRVMVEMNDPEEITESGIIIPDSAKEKPQEGVVVAVGTDDNIDVAVGDSILFGKWSGTPIKVDGNEYLIIKESEIMGVL
jgi:chaperonin GroES|uniref:Co-chaperonin GroES n=1 Tax=uncultured virus TaxID=340016 RepID=A0A221S4G8_9VIRU|nr:co-chaperonin GroES [uncultured virus]